jgi:hypothetical protein
LTTAQTGQPFPRALLADTGAGSQRVDFDLILLERDCLLCKTVPQPAVSLRGAFVGPLPAYVLRVQIPGLGFDQDLRVVGAPSAPAGFDGIACFRFLNRFTYGNFGDPGQFGLEC